MRKIYLLTFVLFTVGHLQAQNANFKSDSVNNRIPAHATKSSTSTDALQATLYEIIDQKLAVHQAHWNVRGPQFISLHEMLGDMYGELDGFIDQVAERKLALGKPADGRPAEVSSHANLSPVTSEFVSDHHVVDHLSERYKTISERLEARIETTGKSDTVTQDLLIALRNTIDLHLWKLRSFNYSK